MRPADEPYTGPGIWLALARSDRDRRPCEPQSIGHPPVPTIPGHQREPDVLQSAAHLPAGWQPYRAPYPLSGSGRTLLPVYDAVGTDHPDDLDLLQFHDARSPDRPAYPEHGCPDFGHASLI